MTAPSVPSGSRRQRSTRVERAGGQLGGVDDVIAVPAAGTAPQGSRRECLTGLIASGKRRTPGTTPPMRRATNALQRMARGGEAVTFRRWLRPRERPGPGCTANPNYARRSTGSATPPPAALGTCRPPSEPPPTRCASNCGPTATRSAGCGPRTRTSAINSPDTSAPPESRPRRTGRRPADGPTGERTRTGRKLYDASERVAGVVLSDWPSRVPQLSSAAEPSRIACRAFIVLDHVAGARGSDE